MRCAVCNSDTPPPATACSTCGASLTAGGAGERRRRAARAADEHPDSPISGRPAGPNRAALRAYRLAVLALVPGLGLLLGPLAAALGLRAHYRARANPDFTGHAFVRAAVVLGVLVGVTNWVGLALMVLGLRSGG
jgi:hypothetical protein